MNRSLAAVPLVSVFLLLSVLGLAAGVQEVALKAGKVGKGASGQVVIVDNGGNQKDINVTTKGLEPNSVYTVWLVNMKPGMDMTGLGKADYSFKTDHRGSGSFSAKINPADLSKWQLIEIAYHPSGDARNVNELMNTALIGTLK